MVSVQFSALYQSQPTKDVNLLHTHCTALTFILEEVPFHVAHVYICTQTYIVHPKSRH